MIAKRAADGEDLPFDFWQRALTLGDVETPVTFQSDNYQLVGILHTPQTAPDQTPAVLFLHGFTGQKVEPHRLFVKTARALMKRGFTALRFDFRGCGDSSGECEDATLNAEIQDARVALEFLRRQPRVDSSRIGIVGMSFGGAVASYVAAADPNVKSLALWCPVADGPDILQRLVAASPAAVASLMTTGFADYGGWRVSKQFVEEFQTMRPVAELAKSSCPVLLIHGEKDETVPVAQAEIYAKALSNNSRQFKRHIIKDASHSFDRADWEQTVIRETVEWLAATV
jgi:pimeloyl-ACP methyl ester carboxylesterase